MDKRIFITGGTGFFGKSMLDYRIRYPEWDWAQAEWVILSRSPERFVAEHPKLAKQAGVSFVSGDVRDFAFPQAPFDAIIHAATSAVTTLSDAEMTSVIVEGARHVVDFAKFAGCKTILFTSSGAVYGPRTDAAHEDDACKVLAAHFAEGTVYHVAHVLVVDIVVPRLCAHGCGNGNLSLRHTNRCVVTRRI